MTHKGYDKGYDLRPANSLVALVSLTKKERVDNSPSSRRDKEGERAGRDKRERWEEKKKGSGRTAWREREGRRK